MSYGHAFTLQHFDITIRDFYTDKELTKIIDIIDIPQQITEK